LFFCSQTNLESNATLSTTTLSGHSSPQSRDSLEISNNEPDEFEIQRRRHKLDKCDLYNNYLGIQSHTSLRNGSFHINNFREDVKPSVAQRKMSNAMKMIRRLSDTNPDEQEPLTQVKNLYIVYHSQNNLGVVGHLGVPFT
jgi:hypothetical protein